MTAVHRQGDGGDTPEYVGMTRRDMLKLGGVGVLAPAMLTGCLGDDDPPGPPTYAATIADARSAIVTALAATATPAISVALVDRERVIWAEAFGVIDKPTRTPPTTDTLFCIGSCSKVLAALATMILVDRRLVDLDAPVVSYVPEFRMLTPEYTRVTVRMLLSHAPGFPGGRLVDLSTGEPVRDYGERVLQTLAVSRLKHAPGEMAVYCNDGFSMIEPLVARVSGRSYAQFVADEILRPLGMTRSRYPLEPFAEGSYAPGYAGEVKRSQEYLNAYASGGLYSTPAEMGRFARMLLNQGALDGNRIVSAAALAEMGRDQTLGLPLRVVPMPDGIGLGWDGVRSGAFAPFGITGWHKNGGTFVYASQLVVLPQEGLAVMVTGSSLDYGTGVLADRILLNALVENGRIAALPMPLPSTPGPAVSPNDGQLADLAGIHARSSGLLRVEAQADRSLTVSTWNGTAWADAQAGYRLRGDGWFARDSTVDPSYRSVEERGERYLVSRSRVRMQNFTAEIPAAQKLRPGAPLSAAWRARIGRVWVAVNVPPTSATLEVFGPALRVDPAPDLPGYLLLYAGPDAKDVQIVDASASDDTARMCLKIPIDPGRDLTDVVIEAQGSEAWVRLGTTRYRPAESIAPIEPAVEHVVTIAASGDAEWRRCSRAGRLTIAGATAWRIYDGDYAQRAAGRATGNAIEVALGDAVLLCGSPGSVIRLVLA